MTEADKELLAFLPPELAAQWATLPAGEKIQIGAFFAWFVARHLAGEPVVAVRFPAGTTPEEIEHVRLLLDMHSSRLQLEKL